MSHSAAGVRLERRDGPLLKGFARIPFHGLDRQVRRTGYAEPP